MNTSTETSEIFAALAKAQGAFPPIKKNKTNPYHGSKYADLEEILSSTRPALSSNGLSVTQGISFDAESKCALITTRLLHSSGQWMEDAPLLVPVSPAVLDKLTKEKGVNAHCVAAACTYGKRISLASTLGVAAEDDDDGNAASNIQHQQGPRVQTGQQAREAVEKVFATKLPPPMSAPMPTEREPGDDSETSPVVPFGKNKGMKLSELNDKQLVWYFNAATENVADPAKEKFRAKEQVWLNAISEEMAKRGGA